MSVARLSDRVRRELTYLSYPVARVDHPALSGRRPGP